MDDDAPCDNEIVAEALNAIEDVWYRLEICYMMYNGLSEDLSVLGGPF